jgi:hypothetical protein
MSSYGKPLADSPIDCTMSLQGTAIVSDSLGRVPSRVRGRGLLYRMEADGIWHVVGGGHDRISLCTPYRAYHYGALEGLDQLCRHCYFGTGNDSPGTKL